MIGGFCCNLNSNLRHFMCLLKNNLKTSAEGTVKKGRVGKYHYRKLVSSIDL